MGARIISKPNLSQELTAVILAAGHGTRMRSRTPKVLHPICGRPMVDWVVDAVIAAGATDVKAIVSSHHAEVAAHLEWLRQFGDARLSGSGACVFVEFATEREARAVLSRMPVEMRGFAVRGLDSHPLAALLEQV